jgi:hypothetical protein
MTEEKFKPRRAASLRPVFKHRDFQNVNQTGYRCVNLPCCLTADIKTQMYKVNYVRTVIVKINTVVRDLPRKVNSANKFHACYESDGLSVNKTRHLTPL